MAPSGCSRTAVAICRSSVLISAASVLSVATMLSTSCRRAPSSTLADASLGRAPELLQQLGGLLATAVVLALEERLQALLAERARVRRARVALQERQRDRAVEIGEQADRAGPETLQL